MDEMLSRDDIVNSLVNVKTQGVRLGRTCGVVTNFLDGVTHTRGGAAQVSVRLVDEAAEAETRRLKKEAKKERKRAREDKSEREKAR